MLLFLRLFLRNIKNKPRLFFINITSFSIGITAVMFIFLFVVKEFNSDTFHSKHKNIYRVLISRVNAPTKMSSTSFPMGDLLKNNYSEIERYTQYIEGAYYLVHIEENHFKNQKVSFVDSSFFQIFDFKLKSGDYHQLFSNPNTALIDSETAKRYFNTTNVLGRNIEIEVPGIEEKQLLTIVGVLKNYPEESTLQPKIVTDIGVIKRKYADDYFTSSPQLFLYIPGKRNITELSKELAATYFSKENEFRTRKAPVDVNRLSLQKLSSIYLHSTDVEDNLPKGDFKLLWILTGISILLLVIIFANYIILNIGLGIKNQKQNQINQILGANSGWLRKKYISESVFYVIIVFFLALFLIPLAQKIVAYSSEYHYSLFSKSDLNILGIFFFGLILLGVFSGWIQYIGLTYRKKAQPELIKFKNQQALFKYLAPSQLFVFIVLLTALFVCYRQVQFIHDQDLGFDTENTITVNINNGHDSDLFVEECRKLACVENFSVGHTLFQPTPYLNDVTIDETLNTVGSQTVFGDQNYIETYDIELLAGTNINGDDFPLIADYYNYSRKRGIIEILVNEEFVRKSGLKDPLGEIVTIEHNGTCKGRITGIVKDVKNLPFYESVTPMVIGFGFSHSPSVIVRVKKGQIEDFRIEVNRFLKRLGKESYFGYGTLSYNFENWYEKETTLKNLLMLFSVVTLVILVLGLVGVSLFITQIKTKEIGIRKVNGAKVSEILSMLNKDFIKWVAIAFVIATPVAYYAMNKWLENFAYKTNLSWWIFALAGVLALGIALLTVSWQSWRAATRNPVEALRYE
ncbi:ABC transporter permease [uncultured Draconibacterium sp.]|uniref:ABC transporter permease n=1 Tax=uncultured Draconibacterium sp. TaxID=1573823 RepID=UPI0025E5518A|nr:ABC transporter permease [uncultured Draconibacterium sp.]